ncbi:MAG: hypothetical protein NVSMB2_00840 [Chloroflexota bacterium]
MVLLVLHGEAGGWDELIIAVVALVVMWIAVKIAGRKSVSEEDEADTASTPSPSAHMRVDGTSSATSDESVAPRVGTRG